MHGHRLTWSSPGTAVSEPCAVCAAQAGEALVSAADGDGGPDWSFARCGHCDSVYLREQEQHVAHDEGLEDELFLTWYLESGAGLEAMLPPLVAYDFEPGTSFLDVGCGYGFSTWWVQEHLRGRAVGLERASYGAAGAQALGIEVRPDYLLPGLALTGGPYQVVHASEVIEHVADPGSFLISLRQATAPAGRLVLTTPDADSIRQDRPAAEVVEALSPGLHRFLLSEGHLSDLLNSAGFSEQRVVRNGGHLVVWAASEPMDPPRWEAVDPAVTRDAFLALERSSVPALARGATYRSFRAHVQQAELPEARDAWKRLRQRLVEDLGLDIATLTTDDVESYTSTVSPRQRLGRWPSFLGPLLFWAGMLETLDRPGDVGSRTRLFSDAVAVMRHDVATGHRFAHEAAWLVERARFHLLQVAAQTVAREAPVLAGVVPDELPISAGAHVERTRAELQILKDALSHLPNA